MEGKKRPSVEKGQQQSLDWCDTRKIVVVQQRLSPIKEEQRKEEQEQAIPFEEKTLIQESFGTEECKKKIVVKKIDNSFFKDNYLKRQQKQVPKEKETHEITVLNEAFFKNGYMKGNKIRKILLAREKMLKNKSYIPSFIPPEKIVFTMEEDIRKKNEQVDDLIINLWYPFKKYNLSKKKMNFLIGKTKKALEKKGRIILPSELITLAALNKIDNYLEKPNTSNKFFKTRVLDDLQVGRRASATRELKRKGYIRSYGSRWKRTEKEFDEADFSLQKIGRAK